MLLTTSRLLCGQFRRSRCSFMSVRTGLLFCLLFPLYCIPSKAQVVVHTDFQSSPGVQVVTFVWPNVEASDETPNNLIREAQFEISQGHFLKGLQSADLAVSSATLGLPRWLPQAYVVRGLAKQMLKDDIGAYEDYRLALRSMDGRPYYRSTAVSLRLGQALIWLNQGKTGRAEEKLELAYSMDHTDISVRQLRRWVTEGKRGRVRMRPTLNWSQTFFELDFEEISSSPDFITASQTGSSTDSVVQGDSIVDGYYPLLYKLYGSKPSLLKCHTGQLRHNCYEEIALPSGVRYRGEFREGYIHGRGVYTFKDGSQYIGEFRRGGPGGFGVEFGPDGNITRSGRWAGSQLLESHAVDLGGIGLAMAVVDAQFRRAVDRGVSDHGWLDGIRVGVERQIQQLASLPDELKSEVPEPILPAANSLRQENWETNEEFSNRLAVAKALRGQEIERLQQDYKRAVDERNRKVAIFKAQLGDKLGKLPDLRHELTQRAVSMKAPKSKIVGVDLDRERGTVILDVDIESFGTKIFHVNGSSANFRDTAINAKSSLLINPVVKVNIVGEIQLTGLSVVAGDDAYFATPSAIDASLSLPFEPLKLSEIFFPSLSPQSNQAIDRNQGEQIPYKEENALLRREIDELRRGQELALAREQARASVEVSAPEINAHALVIGNASYPGNAKLSNPVNDARAISAKLRSLGFNVTEAHDTDRASLVKTLSRFSKSASTADLTLLFYAGHGAQISGVNYIIPIDLNIGELRHAALQGISLNSVVEHYLPGKTKLVLLDACRDNPLMTSPARSATRGLAPITVAHGTLIAFATKDGQTADDGVGAKNSPFTSALLEHLSDPDDIAVVLRSVRSKVMQKTNGRQQPWEYGSLTGGMLVLSRIKPTKGR